MFLRQSRQGLRIVSRRMGRFLWQAAPIVVVLSITAQTVMTAKGADLSSAEVKSAINGGVKFLISKQREDGSWAGHPGQPGGLTSLCTLALLNSGRKASSPEVARALKYLRGVEPKATYAVAMQTMVFAAAEPERDRLLIRRNAKWLVNAQQKSGIGAGAWVGSRATILPGVKVGPGAVIGAGAVVIKDVDAHTLVGGVPAKVMRCNSRR